MTDAPQPDRAAWFPEARLGMFIHWGVYSIPARGEWAMNRERTPHEEYKVLADKFRPKRYDPHAWAAVARDAGMKYMVLTTRHHDGFCLFDSQHSDFTATKTAAGRDLVAEYADACRSAGLKVGFYYSLKDWHRPDWLARQNGDEQGHARFLEYIHGQVRELCTNYGEIDVLWYDGPGPYDAEGWQSDKLNAMVRELQPHILINDRSRTTEDFATVEQHLGGQGPKGPWEFCVTMNENWGYARNSEYKSVQQLIDMLVDVTGRGGNTLLNVGPKPDGRLPSASLKRLRRIGKWMDVNGESIYGCTGSPLTWTNYGRTTMKGENVYVHFSKCWPKRGKCVLAGLKNPIRAATILGTDIELKVTPKDVRMVLSGLPRKPPDKIDTVVKIEVEGPPEVHPYPQ